MKRRIAPLIVVFTLALTGTAGAAPGSGAYFTWLQGMTGFNQRLGTSFHQLSSAMQAQDDLATFNALTSVGSDGRWLKKRANSPDPAINRDIIIWANDLILVESAGKAALAGKGPLKKFLKAESLVSKYSQQVALDIGLANDRYRKK